MNIWDLRGNYLKYLSEEQIEHLHLKSLKLLAEVGIMLEDDESLQMLEKRGATIDYAKKLAFIPASLAKEALNTTPDRITLGARNKNYDLQLEMNRVYFGPGTQALYVLDLETGEKRSCIEKDIYDFPRFIDALDYQHFYKTCVYPSDLDSRTADLHQIYAAYASTEKSVAAACFSPESAEYAVLMAEAMAGGKKELSKRPYLLINILSSSPLKWANTNLQILKVLTKNRMPVIIGSEPQAGTTSPAPLSSAVLMSNTENLAVITLSQILNPGTPVMYGAVGSIADMKTGNFASGAVELGIMNAMSAQMAQYYKIPMYATGGMSDSKKVDVQSGYEKAMQILLIALAGGNYIHDTAGLLEFCLTASFEQYVIDNEMCGMAARAISGPTFTEEALAVDIISNVGPGGSFIAENHTFDWFKKEHFLPTIADRQVRQTWEALGSKGAEVVAKERSEYILKNHYATPLSDDIDKELKKIIKSAEDKK